MQAAESSTTFSCKVSFAELYNEVVTDLLDPATTRLRICEDTRQGVYVEGLSEALVSSGAHCGSQQSLGRSHVCRESDLAGCSWGSARTAGKGDGQSACWGNQDEQQLQSLSRRLCLQP